MIRKRKSVRRLCLIIATSLLIAPGIGLADNFQIDTGIPGPLAPSGSGGGILGFIQNAYLFALGIAGLLALGSIVWGAIQYTTSRGNPSKLNDAWDRIVQALIGILLLVGAGTLLSIVNPGLLSLQLPELARVGQRNYTLDLNGTLPIEVIRELDAENPAWRKATGSGKCVDGAGTECGQDRMAQCSAWDASKASKVCMVESGGGNPMAMSGSDRCSTASGGKGASFSLGLFQINVADHATNPSIRRLLPQSCLGLFSSGGKGTCVDCRKGGSGPSCQGGVCFQWSCQMTGSQEQYEQCRRDLAGPQGVAIACQLYKNAKSTRPWSPWAWTAGQVCKMGLGA